MVTLLQFGFDRKQDFSIAKNTFFSPLLILNVELCNLGAVNFMK
jgi:hypothetical protein